MSADRSVMCVVLDSLVIFGKMPCLHFRMGSHFGAICIKCFGLQRIATHSCLCTGYLLLMVAIRCANYDFRPRPELSRYPAYSFRDPAYPCNLV